MCRLLFRNKKRDDRFITGLMAMKEGGPDDTQYRKTTDGSEFGHNRLSILDLSSSASQPMTVNRVTILFNGEIYNYRELKLKHKISCSSTGDTELLLRLYDRIGEKMFDEIDGEYAIVLKDGDSIYAARDPLGVKPLYWFRENGELIISSEIRGIRGIKGNYKKSLSGISHLLQFGFSDEATCYEGIRRFDPGILFQFAREDGELLRIRSIKHYIFHDTYTGDPSTLVRDSVSLAVEKRMISDVPVSLTLSGGLDSSIIAGIAASKTNKPLKAYRISIEGYEDDEEKRSYEKVCEKFGLQREEVLVTPEELLKLAPAAVEAMEEPSDKGSLLQTYALSSIIKEKVTLVGEGADEVFGGYKRHEKFREGMTDKEYLSEFMDIPLMDWNHEDVSKLEDPTEFDVRNELHFYHTNRIDKNMMRFGVEARVPYLDPAVVRVGLAIPLSRKIRSGVRKIPLREAFADMLPAETYSIEKKALKAPFEAFVSIEHVRDLAAGNGIGREKIEELFAKRPRNWDRAIWLAYLVNVWYGEG